MLPLSLPTTTGSGCANRDGRDSFFLQYHQQPESTSETAPVMSTFSQARIYILYILKSAKFIFEMRVRVHISLPGYAHTLRNVGMCVCVYAFAGEYKLIQSQISPHYIEYVIIGVFAALFLSSMCMYAV